MMKNVPHCPWRFAGQYEDEESGLYYNRFRYYDCETGQYISADPIGLEGGISPYGYVANPLSWIDPLGLAKNKGGGTPKDAKKTVDKQQGPREIERIDGPAQSVPGSQWHAHDKNGGALNQDGSIHDKCPGFPNKVLRWLQDYGWNVDDWL